MADSFIFYRSFYTALSHLDAETFKDVMGLICDYAFDGTVPECDGVAAMAFDLIRPQLDANARRRANGKKGGRPKTKNNLDETKNNLNITKAKPSESNPEPNVNVNVNVNENDNDNVNGNVNVNGGYIRVRG